MSISPGFALADGAGVASEGVGFAGVVCVVWAAAGSANTAANAPSAKNRRIAISTHPVTFIGSNTHIVPQFWSDNDGRPFRWQSFSGERGLAILFDPGAPELNGFLRRQP